MKHGSPQPVHTAAAISAIRQEINTEVWGGGEIGIDVMEDASGWFMLSKGMSGRPVRSKPGRGILLPPPPHPKAQGNEVLLRVTQGRGMSMGFRVGSSSS